MKKILKRLLPVWCVGVLLAGAALADSGSDNWMDDPAADMPSYEMSGWFFNPTAEPFPNFSDPSLEWTSQSNIDLLHYWLQLVEEFSVTTDPGSPGLTSLELPQTQSQSLVPEPMTISLLGCGLLFLFWYRHIRIRAAECRA